MTERFLWKAERYLWITKISRLFLNSSYFDKNLSAFYKNILTSYFSRYKTLMVRREFHVKCCSEFPVKCFRNRQAEFLKMKIFSRPSVQGILNVIVYDGQSRFPKIDHFLCYFLVWKNLIIFAWVDYSGQRFACILKSSSKDAQW